MCEKCLCLCTVITRYSFMYNVCGWLWTDQMVTGWLLLCQPAASKTTRSAGIWYCGAGAYLPDKLCSGTALFLIKPADYWSCPKDREPFTSSHEMDCHYPYSSVMNLTCGERVWSRATWHLLSYLNARWGRPKRSAGLILFLSVMRRLPWNRNAVPSPLQLVSPQYSAATAISMASYSLLLLHKQPNLCFK